MANGLFTDPREVLAQQAQEDALFGQLRAQGAPRLIAPLLFGQGRGAQQLRRGIGGLFGGQDPRLDRARRLQEAQQELIESGLDVNDPRFLPAAASALQRRGLTQEALKLQEVAAQRGLTQAQTGLVQAKTFAALAPGEADVRKVGNQLVRVNPDGSTEVLFTASEQPDPQDANSLRSLFVRESQDFITLRNNFAKIEQGVKRPSAIGDVALVFSFMKMIDPESTVREGEFAQVGAAAGLPDRIVRALQQVDTGEQLTKNQRAQLLSASRDLFRTQKRAQNQLESEFRRIASESGISPSLVVVDFSSPTNVGASASFPSDPDQQGFNEAFGGNR